MDCPWTCTKMGFGNLEEFEERTLSTFQNDLKFDYVKEIYLFDMNYEEIESILRFLNIIFPNAKKIIGKFFFVYDFDIVSKIVKNLIIDAPQKEIILKCNYNCWKLEEMNKLIQIFDGKKLADGIYQWNPENNELKMIQLTVYLTTDKI